MTSIDQNFGLIRDELAGMRTEFRAELAGMRTEIGAVRADVGALRADFGTFQGRMALIGFTLVGVLTTTMIALIIAVAA